MRDLAVGDELDQYRVVDLLARSGMASVFKAEDQESGASVVLKVPHVQYESDVVFFERFQREEEIGRRLAHPYIVRTLAPREKSRVYLALEYVAGPSLRATLRAHGSLETERALDIARQLCEALSYLEERGVVHRDLKPENVLLVPPDGKVKLLDFGIALLDSARRLTWAGLSGTLGTPDYMAPERIRGRRGDARTDVYALGTVLYEMLTGRLPYQARNPAHLLHAKTHRSPTPPSAYLRDLGAPLEAIVLRSLALDPRDRYASAAEMLEDLRAPCAPRPRTAKATRPIALLPTWRRALLVLATAAGVASAAWLARPHPLERPSALGASARRP